ncbi:MAG: hypothetical protein ACI8UO_005917 [Verrucomicrobiales bacterium]|jgi:hypothetical protein
MPTPWHLLTSRVHFRLFVPRILFAWILATSPVTASPLLALSEPREGLLGDETEFAQISVPAEVSIGGGSYAGHLKRLQSHYFATRGKHPPIYYFFCTVYYTPRESGFVGANGFDMTPDKRLRGRVFPKSYVNAVRVEGFGRLAEPTSGGSDYINYEGGYYKRTLGNRNNTLVDRTSAAVYRRHPLLGKGTPLRTFDPFIYNCFGGSNFECADTGGGLAHAQIDLYWGEDDPLDALHIYEPASCPINVRWIVPVIIDE